MRRLDGTPTSLGLLRGALAACLAWALAGASAAAGIITIVEGDATIVDGARTMVAAEGLKLPDDVILRTSAKAGLVRIEWSDGTVADFGPDTQALINPPGFAARGGRAPSVFMLRGWVKQASLGSVASGAFIAQRIDVQPFKGALVALVGNEDTWVFAESGALQVAERDAKAGANLVLKSGEVYSRAGVNKGSVAARPTPAQMQRVPRGFRDTLPLRTAALKDRQVEPRLTAPVSYAELRDWLLVGDAAMRRAFVKRYSLRAREPAFRAAMNEQLVSHPEWEPVLFPERFIKAAPAASR